MFGYSTTTTTTINYTHCCKFYSEEDKHITVNRLSIAEAGIYSKEHNTPTKNARNAQYMRPTKDLF